MKSRKKETVEFNPDDPVFVSRFTAVIRNVLDRFLHESGDPIGATLAAMSAAANGCGFAGSLEITMTDADLQHLKVTLAEDDELLRYDKSKQLRFPLHVAVLDERYWFDTDIKFDGGEMDVANLRWSDEFIQDCQKLSKAHDETARM
jgi:hypothetical protein